MADIVPAILEPGRSAAASPLPAEVLDARAVVVLVLDGLGAEQLAARRHVAPTLNEMHAATITTVAPSTTATALTSIATGVGVGEHGIVGYRIRTYDGNLNVLKWRTPPRRRTRTAIRPSGSSRCRHSAGSARLRSRRPSTASRGSAAPTCATPAASATRCCRALRWRCGTCWPAGESFVYAYYEGLDIVAHEHAFGEHYDAELRACDRLMADLLTILPKGSAVVAISDHGLVDCSEGLVKIDRSVLDCAQAESGEARFRWLHARPGRDRDLYEAATGAHGEQAWVHTASEIVDGGWLGPVVTDAARSRFGRRGPGGPRRLGLRPSRRRRLQAHRPARLAHIGRDAGAASHPRVVNRSFTARW